MPLGSSKTGLNTPNTAGSSRVGDDIIRSGIPLIGRSRCRGVAVTKAARTRHHERNQNQTLTPKPNSQMGNKTTRSGFKLRAAEATEGATNTTGGRSKGMLISATTEIGPLVTAG